MSESEQVAISVKGVSKTYRVWPSPLKRFQHAVADAVHDGLVPQVGADHALTRYFQKKASSGFREVHALHRISLQIAKGEVVGVIGYNGSGKSTLLQILAGTLTPTEGEVQVSGRVAALLELGSGFNSEFTGRENAFLYGSILGVTRAEMESRMHAIEEFAEIGEFIDEPVKTFSTGMMSRLAFAVLTQLDPDILIVDEALSVGDAYFQQKSINLIRQFQAAGKTMFVCSHDLGTIKSMCSRVIILERGVVIRDGPATAVCDYYNALVAKKHKDQEIQQTECERGRIITRSGNRRVVVGDVEILDRLQRTARAFTVGEDACLACVLEFSGDVENPTVGALLRDRLGNDVFGTNTFHLGKDLGRFRAGERCEVRFDLRLNLAPGRYSVTVAAHAGRDHLDDNFDWQDNVLVFDVLPGGEATFVGTAWLPVTVAMSRENIGLLRHYEWGTPIDFSLSGDAIRHKTSGWSQSEAEFTWTEGGTAVLSFFLPSSSSARTVVLRAAGFCSARVKEQHVTVFFDEVRLGEWKVSDTHDHSMTIPADLLLEAGYRRLRFQMRDATSPLAEGISGDPRDLGLRVYGLKLL